MTQEQCKAAPYIIEGGMSMDDRGFVSFVNDFNFLGVKRFYMVENHSKNFVRAWHGHKKEAKYVFVSRGSAMFAAIPLHLLSLGMGDCTCSLERHVRKFFLSEKSSQILYIPEGYANGFMTLTEGTQIFFFSTTTLQESQGDDYRFPAKKVNIWSEDWR